MHENAHEALHSAPDLVPRCLRVLSEAATKNGCLQQCAVDQVGQWPDRLGLYEALRDEDFKPLLSDWSVTELAAGKRGVFSLQACILSDYAKRLMVQAELVGVEVPAR